MLFNYQENRQGPCDSGSGLISDTSTTLVFLVSMYPNIPLPDLTGILHQTIPETLFSSGGFIATIRSGRGSGFRRIDKPEYQVSSHRRQE